MSGAVRTTCPYCGVGCGVLASRGADSGAGSAAVTIAGDPDHPANRGRLCSKGSALGDTVGLDNRLLRPRVAGTATTWERALDTVADGFRRAIDAHGADAVALYVSGQLLTEDYYVANKLMKGFIGTANIDTNSRLCMASAVAAHKRAFGEDLVPVSYQDVELADLVVLVGSNLAWCHPVLYQRLLHAKQSRPGMRVVVIDPRSTPTCGIADLHLALRPGSDALLFNGLLSWLAQHGADAADFVQRHTRGAARSVLLAHNSAGESSAVARGCGLEPAVLRRFYEWFTATERVVTLFSQGVNQSSCGTDKANSIINAHLFTGRIGRPGMGPFSITGQPNAMGGREVGGFANTLAAHLDLENADHRRRVQEFWQAPRIAARPGLKAVELFEAIHRGQIKALWIMGTNPVVSMPNADRTRAALARCEFVVISEVVARTDCTPHAHVLLPALGWGEKEGTVTNSDRHISRQRAFLPAPGEARADWWALVAVAKRLGFAAAFAYETPAQIFDEHARLSQVAAQCGRVFDLSGLTPLTPRAYDELAPVQWPVLQAHRPARLFADGRFAHPDGRARLVPIQPRLPTFARDREYPLILNTGRLRDQWHSMTRTGRSARLSGHRPEPFVDMHAADVSSFGVEPGTLVRVLTRWGSMVARLRVDGGVARGSIFVPIHWNGMVASDARVGALVNPSVDPLSGEPEFKYTPARVEPFVVNWYGFVLSRRPVTLERTAWWACAESGSHRSYEIAGRNVPVRWPRWARAALGIADAQADWIDYQDAATGTYRAALFMNDRLEAYLCINPQPALPPRAWIAALFEAHAVAPRERLALLAARPAEPVVDTGVTVCACFSVGRKTLEAAIAQGCTDTLALGRRLKAGSNCGSCLPEIRQLIAAAAVRAS